MVALCSTHCPSCENHCIWLPAVHPFVLLWVRHERGSGCGYIYRIKNTI
jgi:hypothetical protein